MILLNGFFSLIGSSELNGVYTFDLRLNPDHLIYKGHFPSGPVTPGVIQLQIVEELTSVIIGKKLILHKINRCKFLDLIDPLLVPLLKIEISLKEVDDLVHVVSIIKYSGQIFMKGVLQFE
jgi:3-hydroxyacyl-[acyl-carrier-protein] dehydratase